MPRSATVDRPDDCAHTGCNIALSPQKVREYTDVRAPAYANIPFVIMPPSISSPGQSFIELLKDFPHAAPDILTTVMRAALDQERRRNDVIYSTFLAYNYTTASLTSKREDSRHKELTQALLQRMLPLSYAIWAAMCLVAAAISWTMFAYGLGMGLFVIGPWLNLMLCVASTGLSATVVTAIIDWRRKYSGQRPKR